MRKVKVCGPSTLQRAVMMKAWKEAKEKEKKGQYVSLGELMTKHRKRIKEKLHTAKACIEIDI